MYAMDRTTHEEHRREPRRRPWGSRREDTFSPRPTAERTRRSSNQPERSPDDFAD